MPQTFQRDLYQKMGYKPKISKKKPAKVSRYIIPT